MAEIIWFKDCSYKNKSLVGGKCGSLGELHHFSKKMGFLIADGFAITTKLYDEFIKYNNLTEIIKHNLAGVQIDDITALDVISCELRHKIFEANFINT